MKKIFTLLFVFGCLAFARAQEKRAIEISGVVITADSIPRFIPYANILVKSRNMGAASSSEGFFSFAALTGDTLEISCIGFKNETLIIPDTLEGKAYLSRVVLARDTTMLDEVTLYPWPRPEDFKREFLATNIPMTQEDIALRNLAIQELKSRAAEMGYSPDEIQEYAIRMQELSIYNYSANNIYSNGGAAILGRLSDPFAWAQFFESLAKK